MRRINLLPWRAELRKQRRNQFVVGLGGALVAAAIVLGIANLTFSRIISHQQSRNALFHSTSFLQGQNAGFIERLQAAHAADPASVDASWAEYFRALDCVEIDSSFYNLPRLQRLLTPVYEKHGLPWRGYEPRPLLQ